MRWWFIVCFGLGNLASLAGQTQDPLNGYKIAFVGTSRESTEHNATVHGVRQAVAELERSYRAAITLEDRTPVRASGRVQDKILRQLYVDRFDGVILHPAEPQIVKNALFFLNRQGIPVVTLGQDVAANRRVAFVEPDIPALAEKALEIINENVRREAVLAILDCERNRDFAEALDTQAQAVAERSDTLRIHGTVTAEPDHAVSFERLRIVTRADRDEVLDAWLIMGAAPMIGSRPYLPLEGRDLEVVAIASDPRALRFVESGQVTALVARSYFNEGKTAAEILLANVHEDRKPEERSVEILPEVVTLENIEETRQAWTAWLR